GAGVLEDAAAISAGPGGLVAGDRAVGQRRYAPEVEDAPALGEPARRAGGVVAHLARVQVQRLAVVDAPARAEAVARRARGGVAVDRAAGHGRRGRAGVGDPAAEGL